MLKTLMGWAGLVLGGLMSMTAMAQLSSDPAPGPDPLKFPDQAFGGPETQVEILFSNHGMADAELMCELEGPTQFAVSPSTLTVPASGESLVAVTFSSGVFDAPPGTTVMTWVGFLACHAPGQVMEFPLVASVSVGATAGAPGVAAIPASRTGVLVGLSLLLLAMGGVVMRRRRTGT